jgi:site-specific DNA-adenine methylase
MFFNVQTESAIINDIDHRIFNFFNVLAEDTTYNEFMKQIDMVYFGKDWFEKFQTKPDPVSQAIAFYIQNRNVYGGINVSDSDTNWYNRTKPKLFIKDFSKWKKKMDHCHLTVWNLDFREAMRKINEQREIARNQYVIYEDPPYMKDSLSNVYIKPFTWEDQVDLAKLNHDSDHEIVITYDDHPKVRELYADWYIKEEQFRYFTNIKKAWGTELIISNKPIKRYLYTDHPIVLKKQSDFGNLVKKVE